MILSNECLLLLAYVCINQGTFDALMNTIALLPPLRIDFLILKGLYSTPENFAFQVEWWFK